MAPNVHNPQTLVAIKDLRLLSKAIVSSFLTGIHHSLKKGIGVEFNHYRNYYPGDDLRQLDWKMFARSDRFHIRESETESQISIRFILDASGSMAHYDGKLTKLDYAKIIVASLAHLAHLQGDSISLTILQENNILFIPPKLSIQHLNRIFSTLESVEAKGKFPDNASLKFIHTTGKKNIVVFITDMYEEKEEITKTLSKIGVLRKDLILIHVSAPNEIDFSFPDNVTVKDLETGTSLQIYTQSLRNHYLEAMEKRTAQLKKWAALSSISYHPICSDTSPLVSLRAFLRRRLAM